ncbi:AAA family ATPase [Acinetobacter bereziniae]|uniref:AAA family ATPase n=1 Tax=Acinetobacter bereziniae TaxID=106648 RepID=UPI003213FC09
MNTLQLIEQSKKILTNFEHVSDELYKGEFPIQDKIAGIYYLTFNKEISEQYFEELQYKYLAEEFYNQADSLQWNIYLLFINSNIVDELKVKILKDDKYARKLILNNNEFFDYFKLIQPKQTDLPDIVSDWKEKLNSVGLQELYSPASIESVVRNFKTDEIPEIILEKTEKNLENVPIVEKISSITLKSNYRPFPVKREFKFGAVNLFTGSNGVGKTSLMESIELVLTGKTHRNKNKNESVNCIEATYNDSIVDLYNHNNAYYRERGVKWYKRRLSEQGNKTFESFNQFNFFNTDAASLFANSIHKDLIDESLKQIILGEEYTLLKDRILKVESKLRPELKKVTIDIVEKSDILRNNLSRINELKNDKNFEELKGDIEKNILELGYKNYIGEYNYSISNLFVNEIKTEVDFILSNEWVLNYTRFLEIENRVFERIELVNKNKKIFYENNKEISKLQDLMHNLRSLENNFNSINKYLDLKNISCIESLDENFSKNESQITKINALKELNTLELDFFQFSEEKKTLPEIISEKEKQILNKDKVLKELQVEIKLLEDSFSKFETLINQIRILGKEILTNKLHSDNCPLCEQKISQSELLLKIKSSLNADIDKSILNKKNKIIKEIKSDIDILYIELRNLRFYHSTIKNYLNDCDNLTINEIEKAIKLQLDSESETLKSIHELENLKGMISNIGGSVSEFLSLKKEISKTYPNLVKFDKGNLSDLAETIRKDISENYITIKNFKRVNVDIIQNLNLSLNLKNYAESFEEIEASVKSNEVKIRSIKRSFENLKQYLEFDEDKLILDFSKELNLLIENLSTFRSMENSHNEINKLLVENNDIIQKLSEFKLLNSRLDKATKLLNKLSSNSEDHILEDYFNQNLEEIKNIFTTIHSPKEFTDIKYKDKTLVLFKEEKQHDISEISTGQRGALALSIFISLNRKLINGPNILIFDDPVTFIDDFNALSFLDFLRYFIVKEKKQIFFATANKKFSSLFKKKFDFLGEDDFKEFNLER